MPPALVIVQYIPDDHGDEFARCSRFLEPKLVKLFSRYGIVRCMYLWMSQASDYKWSPTSAKRRKFEKDENIYSNFAHILFKSASDADRACEDAANREITFNNRVLTLTLVPKSSMPIDKLDDKSLVRIFSWLDVESRLKVEGVCRRWRELGPKSWSNVKTLALHCCDIQDDETFLKRCGSNLKKIDLLVECPFDYNLILKYTPQIEILSVDLELEDPEEDVLTEFLMGLKNLKKLDIRHEDCNYEFNFLRHLPESMEEINFHCGPQNASCKPPHIFDLSQVQNLQKLSLKSYSLYGENVPGIEHMKNLMYVDFNTSDTYRQLTRQFQNLTNLKTLVIPKSGITDDILSNIIRNNGGLEVLDVSEAPALTDTSISLVSTLPNLRDLNLSKLSVALDSLDMPSLTTLNCRHCPNITDAVMARLLERSPNLNSLNLSFSSVTPEFFSLANAIVEKRSDKIALTIFTHFDEEEIENAEELSPLVTMVFNQKREFLSEILEDDDAASYNDEKSYDSDGSPIDENIDDDDDC